MTTTIEPSQLFTNYVETGICTINRDMVEHFRECKIVQHGGSFRVHTTQLGVTIEPLDALWLIEELKFAAHPSDMMRRVVIWKD